MLSYEEFCDYAERCLIKELSKEEPRRPERHNIVKENGVKKRGLVLGRKESNIAPVIYFDPYYEEYVMSDATLMEVINRMIDVYRREEENAGRAFDMKCLAEAPVMGCLLSKKGNRDFLKDVPYVEVGRDFVVVFRLYMESRFEGESGSILVNDYILSMLNRTKQEMLAMAITNAASEKSYRIVPMVDFLGEMIKSILPPELQGEGEVNLDDIRKQIPLYVLTNEKSYYGAFAILCPKVLDILFQRISDTLILLPSSIHEWVIADGKDVDEQDLEFFSQIVRSVNRETFVGNEFLGRKAYLIRKGDFKSMEQILVDMNCFE